MAIQRRYATPRIASTAVLTLLVLGPILVHGQTRPELAGVWSTTMTTPNDEVWRIEDFGCFIGCSAAAYRRLRELLNDPANDDRPYEELMVEAWRYGARDLAEIMTPEGLAHRDALGFGDDEAIACKPPGFVRQVLNPVPLEITQYDDRVVLHYEAGGVVRTVYLDGREHPVNAPAGRFGHSIGRYEGSVLVIETVGAASSSFWPQHGGGGHSDQLRAVERYARSDDGSWLQLELVLEDPVMLREPWIYEKVWRFTPDVEILEGRCEAVSGVQ